MNFRQLIEKAMHEAKDEFAAIVAKKLATLMGDGGDVPRRGRGRPPGPSTSSAISSKPAGRGKRRAGTQRRAAPEHMAKIQEKVLHAMTPGQAMKKGDIMKAARIPDDEETRVRNVLAKLKGAGVLSMKGVRGSAVYTLKQ